MLISTRLPLSAAAILVALAAPVDAGTASQTVYAIGNGGTTLVRFQSDNPADVTLVADFGGANTFLDAIDFRPSTGELYGYLDSTDSFYTVNLDTAQLTLASTGDSAAPTNTFHVGMDFNPSIDRLRVISDSTQNIVFNPNTGTAAAFTSLAYGVGDPNENAVANILDNAYSGNLAGQSGTVQYAIDIALDQLVRVANNDGTLTTVGALGVNTDLYTGFDIFTSAENVDTAYAILTSRGTPGFYTIDLATGAATLVGDLGFGNQVYSLAVVPGPATGVLAFGTLALGTIRRGRRS